MPSASLWWFFRTSANSNSLNSLILFGSWNFLSCLEHTSIFSQITRGLHCSLYHYPEPKAMSQTSSREQIVCVVSQRAFKGASCSHVQWVNTNLKSIPRVWSCVLPLYPLQNNGQPNKQWMPCLVAWGHWGVTGLVRDADEACANSQVISTLPFPQEAREMAKWMRFTFPTVITHSRWVGKSPLDLSVDYYHCLLIRLSHNFSIKAQGVLVLAICLTSLAADD